MRLGAPWDGGQQQTTVELGGREVVPGQLVDDGRSAFRLAMLALAAGTLVLGSSAASARVSSKEAGAARAEPAPSPNAQSLTTAPPTEGTRMSGVSYDPVAFNELPAWETDDHLAALKAFLASCPRLIEARRKALATGKSGPRTPPALLAACEAALALPGRLTRSEARAFIERTFQPHRVKHTGMEGLLTGYYEPVLEGSRERQGRFQTPLFKRPPELVTLVKETEGAPVGGGLTYARRTAAGLLPFATRAEIDAGALAGRSLELIYLANPVDVFFLQIQGSGRIRLIDGSTIRVHYDGKNGHPYTSIGRYLIDKGLLAADKMSMGALGAWLKADIERARAVMNQNASYVFFREMAASDNGPPGAIEVPLIAGRSLAVDPAVHALGSLVYVTAPTLVPHGHRRPFNRLMVAHDVGSAIKGPERGDIYFGSGEEAGRVAGKVRHPGNLFVLLAKGPATPGPDAAFRQPAKNGGSGPTKEPR
jgi:membrane-bound lytic murein transglycosylase A